MLSEKQTHIFADLFYLLLQAVKLLGVKKFAKRNIQAVAYHFDCEQLRISAFAVYYIFHRRRRQSADIRKSVY